VYPRERCHCLLIARSGAVVAEFETSSREKAVTNGNRIYRETFNKIVRKHSHRNDLLFRKQDLLQTGGRDGLVVIATGYELDGPGFESWCG
jgi:hypothetical protein